MSIVTIIIDGNEIKAKKEENLLWAALDNGYYIPNLCAIRQADPPIASCRLCFVEIEGINSPVTACTQPVSDGMIVHLDTPGVKKLRNTAFELILSHHHIDCRNCPKNGNCELQKLASYLGLKLKTTRLRNIPKDTNVDSSHPLFIYNPDKCVLCGKCVWICSQQGTGILDFAYRGIKTRVSTMFDIPLVEAGCNSCLACVSICPTGAIAAKPGVTIEKVPVNT